MTWDKQRKCLWVLGDHLYRISYAEGQLAIDKKFKLPMSPTGHDLFPLLRYSNETAKFYKARWWQKVDFSY